MRFTTGRHELRVEHHELISQSFPAKLRSAAAGATAMGAGHAGQRRGVGSLPTADSMARVLRGLVALACVVATTSFNPFLGGVARTRRLRGAPAGVQTRKTSVRIPLRMLDESSDDVRLRLENAFRVDLTGRDTEWQAPPEEMCENEESDAARGAAVTLGLLKQLPIWTHPRVDMAGSPVTLPGLQTLISVREPHHQRMFNELLAGCGPHFFGAIVLEDQQQELVFRPYLSPQRPPCACPCIPRGAGHVPADGRLNCAPPARLAVNGCNMRRSLSLVCVACAHAPCPAS